MQYVQTQRVYSNKRHRYIMLQKPSMIHHQFGKYSGRRRNGTVFYYSPVYKDDINFLEREDQTSPIAQTSQMFCFCWLPVHDTLKKKKMKREKMKFKKHGNLRNWKYFFKKVKTKRHSRTTVVIILSGQPCYLMDASRTIVVHQYQSQDVSKRQCKKPFPSLLLHL